MCCYCKFKLEVTFPWLAGFPWKAFDADLANTFENSSLTTPQQTRRQARGWQSSSPLHPGGRGSFTPNSWREDDQRSLSQGQEKRQEALRQLIQANMARINAFHHRLNEAMVKQGYNVSEDNIDFELYSQKNLIASTDPSLLTSNYEARIKMLNEINENLQEKLQKKKNMLALLSDNNAKAGASSSEPRRSARLRNQKKKSLNDDFLYY